MTYYLPQNVASLKTQPDNLALALRYWIDWNDQLKPNPLKIPESLPKEINTLAEINQQRQDMLLDSLRENQFKISSFSGELKSKMLVGLGGASARENDLSLHHTYGLPYIPASALKGVTRNVVLQTAFAGYSEQEVLQAERDVDNELATAFVYLFGAPEKNVLEAARQGSVLFLDAFPQCIGKQSLITDYTTVHYPDYYGGEKSPTDDQNPNPIAFFAVQKMRFKFHLAVHPRALGLTPANADTLLSTATNWLKHALEHHGVGAKTALGYGQFCIK